MQRFTRLLPTVLLAGLTLCTLVPQRAAGQVPATGPSLLLTNGTGTPVADHEIGDDLRAGLDAAAPLSSYELELRDEAGEVVARSQVTTDRTGNAGSSLLYPRSGVVGCNPDAEPDPDAYRFADFEQAEAVLAGRVFSLATLDALGRELTGASLPIVLRTTPLFFLADGSGCPRWDFTDGTTPFVDGKDVKYAASARIWAVAFKEEGWTVGDEIVDLRPSHPEGQVETLDLDTPIFSTGMLEDIGEAGSHFCILVRLSPDPVPAANPIVLLGDILPDAARCSQGDGIYVSDPWD